MLDENETAKLKALEENKPWLSPIIAPAYTADAGFLVAGGILYTFKVNKLDTVSQRSSLSGSIFFSSRGNKGVNLNLNTFWFESRVLLNSKLVIKDKDKNYYGLGYDKISNTSLSDTVTLYHETFYDLTIDLIYKPRSGLFCGLILNPVLTHLSDLSYGVANDTYQRSYENDYFLNGIGFQVGYDSRDITANPWSGTFINASVVFYEKWLASDYIFQVYTFDTRYYQQLTRAGNLLAFRFYSRSTHGNVPITQLSDFAGGKKIRGYRMGHYRDKSCAYALTEWRYTFQKHDKSLSKSGMVIWAGIAGISEHVITTNDWLPNYGVGYRYELQPRMNVCVDFGFGRDVQGVYFNFTEVF